MILVTLLQNGGNKTKGEPMKKKILILGLLVCVVFQNIRTNNTSLEHEDLVLASNYVDGEKYQELSFGCDYIDYDYLSLESDAEVIARIRVEDDLTAENSTILYSDTYKDILIGFYSNREVSVLEYYKSNIPNDDNLLIIEPTSIMDNIYLHNEGYDALERGKEYIVFLSRNNSSGKLSVIAGETGVINLENVNTTRIAKTANLQELYKNTH